MVSSVFSTVKRYGDFGANFLLGTGADRVGKEIGMAVKARSRLKAPMNLPQSVITGFKKGIARNNKDLVKSGGFLSNLVKTFKETPGAMKTGWKNGTGFFSKLGKSIKPLGKLMPFAMNALWLAQSIPDIVGRTKEEGLWGGIKEAGKALAKMAVFSVSAAVGGTFGLLGMFGLPMVTGMLTDKIVGKSFREKKAEAEEAQQQAQEQMQTNPFAPQSKVGQKLDITSAA